MAEVNERLIRFDVLADDKVTGIKSISLPTIEEDTTTVSGSGIMGEYETPVLGQLSAMEVGLDMTHVSPDVASQLQAPKDHEITVYVAYQARDMSTQEISVRKIRYYMVIRPKSVDEGTLENNGDMSGETKYSCSIFRKYVNGELTCDVEPLNSIYIWEGTDYYADVRTALDL